MAALALLAGRGALPAQAQVVPFVAFTPPGWTWWCGSEGCVLLPDAALPGQQSRFFLVSPADRANAWLPGWMGGADVTWQGPVPAGGLDWDVQLLQGNGQRGAVATAAGGAWSLAFVSPAGQYEADAPTYNAVLKGGAH